MVLPAGLSPATGRFESVCSDALSYGSVISKKEERRRQKLVPHILRGRASPLFFNLASSSLKGFRLLEMGALTLGDGRIREVIGKFRA
jgi:hypothetical protein